LEFKCTRNRFAAGLHPDRLEKLTVLPTQTPGKGKKGEGGKERKRRGGKERDEA